MDDVDRLQMLLDSVGQIGGPIMLWWVSATALTATIFGLVIRCGPSVVKHPRRFRTIRWLGTAFFSSIIVAGVTYTLGTRLAFSGLYDAASRLHDSTGTPYPEGHLSWLIWLSIAIGTTSFIFALWGWIHLWRQFDRQVLESSHHTQKDTVGTYEWRVEVFDQEGKIVAAWSRNDLELPFRPVRGDTIPPGALGRAFFHHFGIQEVTECQIWPVHSDGCSLTDHYGPGATHTVHQQYSGMMVVVRITGYDTRADRSATAKDMDDDGWVNSLLRPRQEA